MMLALLALLGDAQSATAQQPAAGGDADALAALGTGNQSWQSGDEADALEAWSRAAELGNADAQFNLGLASLRAGDLEAALANFAEAAEQNHVLACFALGTVLVSRAPERAAAALKCSAEQGYVPAQFNLAKLLLDRGDIEAARPWLEAASTTFGPARQVLNDLPEKAAPPAPLSVESPAAVAVVVENGAAADALTGTAWVHAQSPAAYTLQVAAGATGEALERMLDRHAPEQASAWFLHRPTAREPFSAVIGSFTDFEQAQRALAELPPALLANQPWIRRFATLQRELQTVAE